MEWLRKFFSDPRTLGVILASGVIGLAVGFVSGLIERKHGGWLAFWQSIGKGIVVAVIVGLGIQSYVQEETMRLCIIGAAAVISDDIWLGLRAIGRLLKEDPLGTIGRLINAFRGKPAAKSEE